MVVRAAALLDDIESTDPTVKKRVALLEKTVVQLKLALETEAHARDEFMSNIIAFNKKNQLNASQPLKTVAWETEK